MNDWVTLRTFSQPHMAALAKSLLESEGIDTYLKDEVMGNTQHFISAAGGGVKLQVRESDATKALEILLQGGYLRESDLKPTFSDRIMEKIVRIFRKK